MKNLHRSLVIGCSALALAGCGADQIASPGTGGNVTINNPAPSPAPAPTPTPTANLATPAANCPQIANPTQLLNLGTITGPTGTYLRCRLPASFTVSTTLPRTAGVLYELNGQTDVGTDQGFASTGNNVTLDIEPGVIIFASGNDFLNVNRGNQLVANGTAARPIIFTSRQNVEGGTGTDSSGQWGGIILSGRAPVTDCFVGSEAANTCQRRVEGATNQILYGGTNSADSSGSLTYVQIRFSGFALSNGDELQSLTTGGVGSGTTFSNIQTYNSSDDGAEFFGGVVNARRMVMIGAEDDSLDTDTGVKGQFDQLLVVQRPTASDTVIEQDSDGNEEAVPRTNVQVNNATFVVNSATGDRGIRIRGSSDFSLFNSLIWDRGGNTGGCINVQGVSATRAAGANDEAGPTVFNSVALDCATDFRGGGGSTAAQVETNFNAGTGNNAGFTNSLQRLTGVTTGAPFINGTNENTYTPIFGFAASSFFSARGYIGAITSEAANWAEGWTCNSATVTLGTSNTGSCDSLPTI